MVSKRFLENTNSMQTDDLKLISGIGPAIERRLHEAGIYTYDQIAALSPDKLAACIKGISVKKTTGKEWISQARKLAAKEKISNPQGDKTVGTNRQRYAAFTVELLLDAKNKVRRTHVKHIQDGGEAVWADWHEADLLAFFVEHAQLRQQPPKVSLLPLDGSSKDGSVIHSKDEKGETISLGTDQTPEFSPSSEETQEVPRTELLLEVCEMQFKEVSAGPGIESPLHKYMAVQLIFQLNGDDGMRVAAQRSLCFVQIIACEVTLEQVIMLAGENFLFEPDRLTYTSTLTFPIPRLGRYKLWGLIMLPEEDEAVTAVGPMLHVIL